MTDIKSVVAGNERRILSALGIRGEATVMVKRHETRIRSPSTRTDACWLALEGSPRASAGAAVAGAAMKKRPFSLDIVGPSAGEYSASVVEVRPVERPDRLFAVITFALDSDPPFSVADFVLLDAERQGTDTNRGRARIRQLIRIAGGDPKSISSPDDLQLLVGARVRVVIRVRERDGIQVPEIASILPPAEER